MFHQIKDLLMATVVLSAVSTTVALAHSYERCDADGDHCVRITCDHDGDRCWRESEYSRNTIYSPPGRWVCDSDGDRCHYEYENIRRHHDHDEDRERDR